MNEFTKSTEHNNTFVGEGNNTKVGEIDCSLDYQKLQLFDETIKNVAISTFDNVKKSDDAKSYNPTILMEKIENHEWLNTYNEKIKTVKALYIYEEPDTFIEAACLCNALVTNKIIGYNDNIHIPVELLFVNYKLAFDVALSVISSPHACEKIDEIDEWQKVKLETCHIEIPSGYIPNETLYHRVVLTIARNDTYGNNLDVMLLSDLLHMIYTYSVNMEKEKSQVKTKL